MTNTTRSIVKSLRIGVVLLAFGVSTGAAALTLDLPKGARLVAEDGSASESYAAPVGPWDGEVVPSEIAEGATSVQAWRVDSQALTTLQVLRPLRGQLVSQGYRLVFECETARCGGYDFRFGTRVLPAPEMLVDLGDFRFLTAQKSVEGAVEVATLLISRTRGAAYVQLIHVAPEGVSAARVDDTAAPVAARPSGPIAQELENRGRVILGDLAFETGSSKLGPGPFDSLSVLAGYLDANPGRRIALVGHTDSVGSLEGNIALSKRRAAAVADRLVAEHGVKRAQIDAEGMGYLAPIAPNLTAEGREANRRVEAVLLSTK